MEFLGLDTSNYKEKDLEEALITHLQKFLLELGRGFTFVARQKRISYDNENYYAVDVWDNTDELLMLLAISENPISDLISVLK